LQDAASNDASSADVKALKQELSHALKLLDMASEKLRSETKPAGPVSSGGGGGGNPQIEKKLRDEVVQLQKDKKQLQATVEELRAEIQAHLQDKEELAKAFEEMQSEQAGGGGGGGGEKEEKDPFDDSGVPNEDEPW
jgi:DNA repair exonuclease SbcCD ATPase subunit